MKLRREHRIAAATVVLAIGVPLGASAWVGARTDALAARIGERGGVTARIGSMDADLTGTIRLSDVALGDVFAAASVEASVALDSLLAGTVAADELRIASPRITITVDRDGDSDLARLVRKLAHEGQPATQRGPGARMRRIVVSSGTLTAQIADLGELSADAVELVPDGAGVRLITGPLRIRAGAGRVRGELRLARSAAEVSLPHVTFGRVLAVAGTGAIEIDGHAVELRDLAIGRLAPGGPLEARGFIDDAGVPRAVSAELAPPDETGFALTLHGDRVPLAALAPLVPGALVLDTARASGELTVRRAGAAIRFTANGSLAGVRLDHATIAPQPVVLDAGIDAALSLSPTALAVERAAFSLGAARWTASGWVRRGTPVSGQLDLQLAAGRCMDLLSSVPIDVRGPLDGLAMTGTLGGRARVAIDLAAPSGEGIDLALQLANDCVVTAEPPAADVTTLAQRPAGDERPWVELRKLPWYIPGAFTSAEDARFYHHRGFDLEQIERSLEIDLRDRRLARGGSTISQQLVKNELLTHRRSLDRKIQEAVLTWRLEERLTKKQILERYLNIIELGPRVHGLAEAARYWFDVPARDLSIRQVAFLAALTAEPQSMSRRVRHAGGLDPASAARVDTILRAMRRDGVITREDHEAARDKPLRFAESALRREI